VLPGPGVTSSTIAIWHISFVQRTEHECVEGAGARGWDPKSNNEIGGEGVGAGDGVETRLQDCSSSHIQPIEWRQVSRAFS
jgi:hypothetical protein